MLVTTIAFSLAARSFGVLAIAPWRHVRDGLRLGTLCLDLEPATFTGVIAIYNSELPLLSDSPQRHGETAPNVPPSVRRGGP